MTHITRHYRPEIDGLRAIAVLSVILCHMNSVWLPGGFIGVDVFFVISGFLITKIIATEIEQNRFSFIHFYVRRIRRILPAFFVVLFTTVFVGWYLFLQKDLIGLLKSAVASILFSSNFYFARENGYFDVSVTEKPLHHMWSLSVEEQFYFLWPLILFAFYRFLGYLNYSYKARIILIYTVIPLNILLFLIAHLSALYPIPTLQTYYLLHARAGELLLGGVLTILPFIDSRHSGRLGLLGLSLIAYSVFSFSERTVFPGLNALLPCAGAGLILYYGQTQKKHIVWQFLSCRPMVFIGLLSYSLYLWHWPILSYARYVFMETNLKISILLICALLMLLLSYLTYQFVECKIRYLSFSLPKMLLRFYAFPSALIFSLYLGNSYFNKPPSINALDIFESYGTNLCHGNFSGDCLKGDSTDNKQPTVLVVGDSHAAQMNTFIDEMGKKEGWLAYVVSGSSCPVAFGYDTKVLANWAQAPCSNLNNYFEKNYTKFNYIIFAGRWQYQLGMMDGEKSDPKFLQKFKSTLDTVAKHRPVYVLSQLPGLNIEPLRAEKRPWSLTKKNTIDGRYLSANQEIKKLVSSVHNAHYVDLTEAFSSLDNGFLYQERSVYFDNNHINIYGAKMLADTFQKRNNLLHEPNE